MSAAIQLSLPVSAHLTTLWAAHGALATMRPLEAAAAAVNHIQKRLPPTQPGSKLHQMPGPVARQATAPVVESQPAEETVNTLAFYRKHTENMLRRYLYASMQVGRSPDLLGESVGRGWVSSRKVRTFEDALIFVLDIERCLKKLTPLDRQLVSRVLLQEYTQAETAVILGISVRSICTKLPQAIDRLTELLVDADLLTLPN